jgi:diguanylate cyclase (GGDEF)-like protein
MKKTSNTNNSWQAEIEEAVEKKLEKELEALRSQGEILSPAFIQNVRDKIRLDYSFAYIEGSKYGEKYKANERENELLEKLAVESLTGVRTKGVFIEDSESYFKLAISHRRDFSIIMIDLDHFKQVNDRLGHVIGDEILAKLGKILKANFRGEDRAYRYGGEEFAVILPETDQAGAVEVAERLRKMIKEEINQAYFGPEGKYRNVLAINEEDNGIEDKMGTVSIGVATMKKGQGYDSANEFVSDADKALYASKNAGRDRVSHIARNEKGEPVVEALA